MAFLGILVLAGVAFFIDVESLKDPLVRKLSQSIGMKVEIEGLAYDFHDGFGLKADGLNIESLDGKEKYASAKTLFVHVYLMPLLAGVVEVKTLDLIQPVITVYLDQDASPEKEEDKPEDSGKPSGTVVDTVRDMFQNFRLAVNNVGIENGQIYAIKRRNGRPVDQQMVRVSAVTKLSRPTQDHLTLALSKLDARMGNLHLKGSVKFYDILARTGELDIQLNLDAFSMKDLKALYFFFPEGLSGDIQPYAPRGEFETLELDLQVPLEAMEDKDTFEKQASIKTRLTGRKVAVKVGDATLPVDSLDTRITWRAGKLDHEIKIQAWSGSIAHKGQVLFREGEKDPVLNTATLLDHVNLTHLGLPEEWGLNNGFASGTLKATGPANPDAITVQATLSGRELLLTPQGWTIPVSSWEADAVLEGRKLKSNLKASAFGGDVTHAGTLTLPASDKEDLLLDSTVHLSRVDVTQLPIPEGAGLDRATLSGSVNAKGPADPDKWTLTAQLTGEDVLLTLKDLDNMPLPVQRVNVDATMQGRKIHSKIKAALMKGELVQDGDIILSAPGTEDIPPVLNTRIQLSKLDLTSVSLPKEWGINKAVLSGDLKATGPASLKRLALSGSLLGEGLVIQFSDETYTVQKADLGINSKPPKAPLTADFSLHRVKALGYPFKRITGRASFPKDKIIVHRSAFVPSNGTLGVKGWYNTAQRTYDFSFGGKGLAIEDYEKKHLKGKVKFTGGINGVIPENGHPARGLNGDLKLLITEGSLKELGAVRAILTILNPTALSKLRDKGLLFDRMGGVFEIKDGLVTTPQMGLEGKFLKVYLKGTADIPTRTLDMEGKALPMGDLDKLLQGVPLLGRFMAGNKIDEGLVETYFTLKGPITDPKVDMQTAKSLIAKPKRIFEKLGDLFSGGDDK